MYLWSAHPESKTSRSDAWNYYPALECQRKLAFVSLQTCRSNVCHVPGCISVRPLCFWSASQRTDCIIWNWLSRYKLQAHNERQYVYSRHCLSNPVYRFTLYTHMHTCRPRHTSRRHGAALYSSGLLQYDCILLAHTASEHRVQCFLESSAV